MVQESLKDNDPTASLRKEVDRLNLKKQQQELQDYFRTSDLNSQVKNMRLEKQQIDLYNNLAEYRKQFKGYLPDRT